MRSSLTRRYLVFLVIITVAVVGAEQLFQWYFLNTTGRRAAERALVERPALGSQLGHPRLGFAWRGHDEWWMPGSATALLYFPVTGERASGTLYLREEGKAGAWTLRKISFRERSSQIWTSY